MNKEDVVIIIPIDMMMMITKAMDLVVIEAMDVIIIAAVVVGQKMEGLKRRRSLLMILISTVEVVRELDMISMSVENMQGNKRRRKRRRRIRGNDPGDDDKK